jgi:hypothetical protein
MPGLTRTSAILPRPLGDDDRLHLHRFEGKELLTLGDLVTGFDGDAGDGTGQRRADVQWVGRVGLGAALAGQAGQLAV